MESYLDLGAAIINRLRDQCPAAKAVLSGAEFADTESWMQFVPALFVLYDGDDIIEGQGRAGRGVAQFIHQRWTIIVAVKSAAATFIGGATEYYPEASVLLQQTIAALQGQVLITNADGFELHRPLVRVTPRGGPAYGTGYARMPLTFRAQIFTQGGTS